MKKLIVAELGSKVLPTKILAVAYSKSGLQVITSSVLENNNEEDMLQQVKNEVTKISKGKIPILLILSADDSKSVLFNTGREPVKDKYISRWVKTHIIEGEQFISDSNNPDKLVTYDIFGRIKETTFGSVSSNDVGRLEHIYNYFKGHKLHIMSARTAHSFFMQQTDTMQTSAIIDISENCFSLKIFESGVLADSQTDYIKGEELITELGKAFLSDRGEIFELFRSEGFSSIINHEGEDSNNEEADEFSGILASHFEVIRERIMRKLNIAGGKRLYPKQIKIIGSFSEIKYMDKWLERGLRIPCEAVLTEHSLTNQGLLSTLMIAKGYIKGTGLREKRISLLKPLHLSVSEKLSKAVRLCMVLLFFTLAFNSVAYALAKKEQNALAPNSLSIEQSQADIQVIAERNKEKQAAIEIIKNSQTGLPALELLSVMSSYAPKGIEIEIIETTIEAPDFGKLLSEESETEQDEEEREPEPAEEKDNDYIILLTGLSDSNKGVSDFITALSSLPFINDYTISGIEEVITEKGFRQQFTIRLNIVV